MRKVKNDKLRLSFLEFLVNPVVDENPHPFKAIVDPHRLVGESNEGNNLSANTINVNLKEICGQMHPYKPQPKPQPPNK